jgi:hypothetical protein
MTVPIPDLKWVESSWSGIRMREDPEVWHAGKVIDVLPLGGDRLLIGCDGGCWLCEADGSARPLSDGWAFPDVLSLAARPNPGTVLCGTGNLGSQATGGLFESLPGDIAAPWLAVNLPPGVTSVNAVAALAGGSRVVIATNNGIWWTDSPPASTYAWAQAVQWVGVPVFNRKALVGGSFSGLAAAGDEAIAVGVYAADPGGNPLRHGSWDSAGDLVLSSRPRISGASAADRTAAKWISVASCAAQPRRVYAVSFFDQPKTGSVQHVYRSDDGGVSWKVLPTALTGNHAASKDLISEALGYGEGGPDKNMSVHPSNADLVSLAAFESFVSDDGGSTWTIIGGEWVTPNDWRATTLPASSGDGPQHYHADHHIVVFAPERATPDRVYVATDGGVFRADDWTRPETFLSIHNRGLRNLQFYDFCLGTLEAPRGVVAGGLQDNGNVWKINDTGGTWRPTFGAGGSGLEGGDGGGNTMAAASSYIHGSDEGNALSTEWSQQGRSLSAEQVIPVGPPGGNPDPNGVHCKPIEPVVRASFATPDGYHLHAVGWNGSKLYGLFGDADGSSLFWDLLRETTAGQITAAASLHGETVIYATSTGEINELDTTSRLSTALAVPFPPGTTANKIVAGRTVSFAAFLDNAGANAPVARRHGTSWIAVKPIPEPNVAGMAIDESAGEPLVYAATDTHVWVSNNRGATWHDSSLGLPARAHCTDLRFNRTQRRLHLGTYGRSAWQAGRRKQIGVSALIQSDYLSGADHHNFEALIAEADQVVHVVKDNDDVENPWRRIARFGAGVTAAPCLISSDWGVDGDGHRNFEALILMGRTLEHWNRDNSGGIGQWKRLSQVTPDASGPPTMLQSDYCSNPDHGNYEALIPMDDGLWHWYMDSATGRWGQVAKLPARLGSYGCICSSDYESNPGHRNLEALVFEPMPNSQQGVLQHFWWNFPAHTWVRGAILTRSALGPAALIQSDYALDAEHRNLEAVVYENIFDDGLGAEIPVLRHWWRNDADGSQTWVADSVLSSRPAGPASLIQGDYHSDGDHGNLEVLTVEADNEAWHHWRDGDVMAWKSGGAAT